MTTSLSKRILSCHVRRVGWPSCFSAAFAAEPATANDQFIMKNTIRLMLAATFLAAVVICVTNSAALAKDAADEPAMPKGSIRVDHKVKPAGLPALARISFEQALKAALAAAPGSVIKAELEVEESNLVYSFE